MTTAILGARGFDMGNSMLNSVDYTNGATVLTTQAKTGTYSLRVGASGSGASLARWALAGTPANPSVSLWMTMAGFSLSYTTSSYVYLRYILGTGEYIELRWNATTHTFDAYVNNALVAAGTVEVSNNDWFHVQFYVVIADAGSITVYIDGHSSIAYSGDTQPTTATGATYFQAYSLGASTYAFYIDNLVFGSGGLLGDLRVYEKRPTSDSTVTWTPSTGAANYALEDETPQSDTDYNSAATNALADEFGLSALDITGLDVRAVIAWSRAQMTDGVGDSLDVGVSSGSTDSVNRNALSTAWEYYFGNVHETDPDSGSAWDQAALNALLHRKVAVIGT